MLQFENIVGAIHSLSLEEKVKLRELLEEELNSPATPATQPTNGAKVTSGLIGLFADEPELMDEVMKSVYEHRSLPLRADD